MKDLKLIIIERNNLNDDYMVFPIPYLGFVTMYGCANLTNAKKTAKKYKEHITDSYNKSTIKDKDNRINKIVSEFKQGNNQILI